MNLTEAIERLRAKSNGKWFSVGFDVNIGNGKETIEFNAFINGDVYQSGSLEGVVSLVEGGTIEEANRVTEQATALTHGN